MALLHLHGIVSKRVNLPIANHTRLSVFMSYTVTITTNYILCVCVCVEVV